MSVEICDRGAAYAPGGQPQPISLPSSSICAFVSFESRVMASLESAYISTNAPNLRLTAFVEGGRLVESASVIELSMMARRGSIGG